MDPQQRLALQVAYEAIESSGYCSLPTQEKEVDVGCYLGVGSVDYEENVASDNASAFSATGTLRAFISGRISHFFGWTGPSITFDTACSSSAVAIHTALREHSNGPLTSSKPLSKGSHQRASATYPILLSARSPKSLELYINALKSYLPKVDTSLGALAYNIFRRQNSSFEHRATFIATDTKTLASVLNSSDKQRLGQTVRTGKSPVVLCFGGQTGRTVTISRDLYDGCDLLRYHLVSPKSSMSWLR